MLIIVEGPDNAGKSTLVARIRRASRHEFVSMLGGRTEDHEVCRKRVYDAINRDSARTLLCERFHAISDDVYRTIYGGRRMFSANEASSIFARLGGLGARVVYCRPPLGVAMATALTKKGDDDEAWIERVQSSLPTLFEQYDRAMNRLAWFHGLAVARYDHTDPTTANEVEGFACAG